VMAVLVMAVLVMAVPVMTVFVMAVFVMILVMDGDVGPHRSDATALHPFPRGCVPVDAQRAPRVHHVELVRARIHE